MHAHLEGTPVNRKRERTHRMLTTTIKVTSIAKPVRAKASPRLIAVALALVVATACSLLSPYDSTSYKNATDLKAESLAVLEKATMPFADHESDVERLRLHLRQAHEYERGKGHSNEETAEQWALLIRNDGNLLGGALARWQQQGALSEVFLQEVLPKVEAGFDEIIALERGKVKK